MQPDPGTYVARWLIVRAAAPEQRAARRGQRSRFLVRCACGDERIVWWEDLRSGRSQGCQRGRCRNAWLYAQAAKQAVGVEAARALCRAIFESEIDIHEIAREFLRSAQGRTSTETRRILEEQLG